MKIYMTSRKVAGGVAVLLLLGTTIAAVTGLQSSVGTRINVCVKDNGQLRMLTDARTTCDPSERPMNWVVGGQVTEIQPGTGLVGTREDGVVHLALDPTIIANSRGGKVFAGFNDGPGPLSYLIPTAIAELDVPAGDYVIFAKLTLEASDEFSIQRDVLAKLSAGTDFDEARVVLESTHSESPGQVDGSYAMGLTMQVVHSSSSAERVVLSAAYFGTIPVEPKVHYRNLKIIAIEASSLSNIFLGSN